MSALRVHFIAERGARVADARLACGIAVARKSTTDDYRVTCQRCLAAMRAAGRPAGPAREGVAALRRIVTDASNQRVCLCGCSGDYPPAFAALDALDALARGGRS